MVTGERGVDFDTLRRIACHVSEFAADYGLPLEEGHIDNNLLRKEALANLAAKSWWPTTRRNEKDAVPKRLQTEDNGTSKGLGLAQKTWQKRW
jgi:hypothetical protein